MLRAFPFRHVLLGSAFALLSVVNGCGDDAANDSSATDQPAGGSGGTGSHHSTGGDVITAGQGGMDANGTGGHGVEASPLERDSVRGLAQKGPFLNGAAVTLSELDADFSQTGRSFQASILDDSGAFELKNVALSTSIATLRVDGFFYNEVKDIRSDSQITLTAITDLSGEGDANVNLLSHLEKARVEYLLGEGSSFEEAKSQARSDVLAIFGFEVAPDVTSEEVSLIDEDAEGAKLLAASVILLGYRTDSELSEIVASLSTDLRTDGVVDSASTMRDLVLHARALDPAQVRAHLEARYEELGQIVVLGDFESELDAFLSRHEDEPTGSIMEYGEGSLLAVLAAGEDGMLYPEEFSVGGSQPMDVRGENTPFSFDIWSCGSESAASYYQGTTNLAVPYNSSQFLEDPDAECAVGMHITLRNPDSSGYMEFVLSGKYKVVVYEGNQQVPLWTRTFTVPAP